MGSVTGDIFVLLSATSNSHGHALWCSTSSILAYTWLLSKTPWLMRNGSLHSCRVGNLSMKNLVLEFTQIQSWKMISKDGLHYQNSMFCMRCELTPHAQQLQDQYYQQFNRTHTLTEGRLQVQVRKNDLVVMDYFNCCCKYFCRWASKFFFLWLWALQEHSFYRRIP